MSNNEIVFSLINNSPSLVVHADDAENLSRLIAELDNDLLNDLDDLEARFKSSETRGVVGMAGAVTTVAKELGGVEVQASPENVPVTNVVPLNTLPEGVNVYTGPQADNPQYQELYVDGISYPMKEALAGAINQHGHKFKSGKSSFLKYNGKGKPYTTSTQNEALVRQFIAANAHLQDA